MTEFQKTGCALCLQSCGLEVMVEDNRIVKVRPDKDNLRSQGYVCRKGLKIAHLQHNAQRLTRPLKKAETGFEPIDWDTALDEISEKLKAILNQYGPESLALMAGASGGCQLGGRFSGRLLLSLGSKYFYATLGQEWTGRQHVRGQVYGNQPLFHHPDHHRTEVLLGLGWNGWSSHGMPRTRAYLKALSEDPDRKLIIIDPRPSETARYADIHLALTPGSDALLLKAMIAIILEQGWQDDTFIRNHTTGLDEVTEVLLKFPVKDALSVCGLDYEQVKEVCRLFTSRKSAVMSDLGVLMNRHSTLVSYLEEILLAITGSLGTAGGNVFTGTLSPIGVHTQAEDPATWRTNATDIPAIMGIFPPNVLPEEIDSERADRIRAVIVAGANPLRSFADTKAYEKAFKNLDSLVVVDVALTETAALAHYVLPSRTAYESFDNSFWSFNFPEIFFQVRQPVIEPEPETRELGWIMTALAKKLGSIPPIPQSLKIAARGELGEFGKQLGEYIKTTPEAMLTLPFVLAETIGETMSSPHQAFLWGLLWSAPAPIKEAMVRAGFPEGLDQAGLALTAILENPQGIWLGLLDPDRNLDFVATDDKRIHFHDPELLDWMSMVTPESEATALMPDPAFPLIMMAGWHMDTTSNTLMRDPAWNKGRRVGCLAVHADDAENLGLIDGDKARLTTKAGQVEVEVQISPFTRVGMVLMPQGFGLDFGREKVGVNVNDLTDAKHRDRLAGTPYHRRVPCRLERF
ncbi:MAG: molybdopterin-dependent oxidoreductase [Deltaproteobacteria bacterium]|nr:molybdopterin-dependent oxidoreductase [Deltaproteobacteria bacterium]